MAERHLLAGRSASCGCGQRDAASEANSTHGFAGPGRVAEEYTIWQGMKKRCYNPKVEGYEYYGGRGVTVCDRWLYGEGGLSGFECFMLDMGPRPSPDHSIDRWPNNATGIYDPGNCRWGTVDDQANNKRNSKRLVLNGEEVTYKEASLRTGIPVKVLEARVDKLGWTGERVFSPVRKMRPRAKKAA